MAERKQYRKTRSLLNAKKTIYDFRLRYIGTRLNNVDREKPPKRIRFFKIKTDNFRRTRAIISRIYVAEQRFLVCETETFIET